ncbi:AzlD domain-containing protein [Micrococcoides hystricis]|uniref:AzlD domain-containing protein n=1 Tax=Micrococcoides hystricis TaxID=1572761 RepID=A0ABV6PDH4_9MICC
MTELINPTVIAAVALLAIGTFVLRALGPTVGGRLEKRPLLKRAVQAATYLLLIGVSITATLGSSLETFSVARLCGVLTGGILAWRKAGFLWIVVAASATTAILRLLGLP